MSVSDSEEPEFVKMVVNQATCIGSGQCEMLEEATFLIDEETVVAGVVGSGMLPPDRAEKVIDRCPVQAISVEVQHEDRS